MMQLKGKKVAVLLDQKYEDQEYWYPRTRLIEEGADVVTVAAEGKKEYPSKHGYAAKSDKAAADVKASDFAAVIIPGGYAPDHMRMNKEMVQLVRDACEQGKVVGAICHGGWMLCSAKVLKGKHVTSYIAIKDDMENAGASWSDKEVVKDGNLITSRKPDDIPAFMRAVIGALIEAK